MTDATVVVGEHEPGLPSALSCEGPQLGTRMGRYIVLSTLATGAMGVVVVAYDPELDRKAALKLIRSRRANKPAPQARLWREAQALAKLSHPNVVTIYDVGTHDEQVFVAMELVHGQTLRAWLDAGPHPWREVVRVLEAAGRGLAAAHAVGLVHRDFKPDNVMIGADGRVRVMDFGLARGREEPAEAELDSSDSSASVPMTSSTSSTLAQRLTQTGTMLGTPAYMAPEQWRRRPATALSDQFAFCVTLYEALYGRRPFVGASVDALRESVASGVIEVPRTTKVPHWLRRAVLRGLAASPMARHASMDALLAALAADPSVRRRRVLGALTVVGLLGFVVWSSGSLREAGPPACSDMRSKLNGTWDEQRRLDIESAILATGHAQAPELWKRIELGLDAYADAWLDARGQACEASLRGEQSGELLDRRMACLDTRLEHLRATTDELARIDGEALFAAEQAIAELPALARCSDVEALLAERPPPDDPALADALATIEVRLVEVEAKRGLGRYREAHTLVTPLLADAERLEQGPTRVRTRLLLAKIELGLGDFEASVQGFEQAYFDALAHAMLPEAAEAAAQLVYVHGGYLSRFEVAESWVPHAEATARASGSDELVARQLGSLGRLRWRQANPAAARELYERQLDIVARRHGPDSLDAATVYFDLGNIAMDERRLAEARAYLERTLAIRRTAFGDVHPQMVSLRGHLGLLAIDEGRSELAYAEFERALAIGEQTLGPDHADVVVPLFNLGHLDLDRRDYARARPRFERALAIFERAFGPEHPNVGACYNNLARVALGEHDLPAAEQLLARSLEIKERALGPDHPKLASTLDSLAEIAILRGDHAMAHALGERSLTIRLAAYGSESSMLVDSLDVLADLALSEGQPATAREYIERALELQLHELGSDHPAVAESRGALGEALLELGHAGEALPLLEQALARLATTDIHPVELAELEFHRARALASTQPERARALVEAIRDQLARHEHDGDPALLAAVEAWLAAH
jgi:serine/threonine protein kinase